MDLVSLAAFAKSHGVSPQAATKWKQAGALVFVGDKVDVAASDDRMRGAGLGRFKAAVVDQPAINRAASTRSAVDALPVDADAAVDAIADLAIEDFVEELLAGRFKTKVDAEAIKENALALKHWLSARKEAGSLVALDVAERALFEASRGARDAWLNFPTRVGPLLAADLGIDQERVIEALTAHVHQQLADIGEPSAEFAGT